MAIVVEGNLACPRCREYVIEANPKKYPDGVDYRTPGADESETPCGECAPHVGNLREPTDTRRIPNSAIRHVGRPRWVAMYEGSPTSGRKEGRRRVGLLVPRPEAEHVISRAQIAFDYTGKLMEFRIGHLPDGSHGSWWTAHANELPREKWQAIRNFYINLSRNG